MLDKFLKFILQKQLFTKKDNLLAAVSGGVDSVVLCDLLYNAGFQFAIAHCNFKLRGKESDGDETFVKALAQKYKVDFYVEHFNTASYAKKEKISLQMAARILRYEWFGKLTCTQASPPEKEKRGIGETERRKTKQFTDSSIHPLTDSVRNSGGEDLGRASSYLLTAHHQNDMLETILFNITKGTGIAGLHGIQPKSNPITFFSGYIIRPLLFAQKEEIYDYAKKNNLKWHEDSSNESNKYQRNLIRNQVIPLLKKINPNLETTIQATVDKVRAAENIFNKHIETIKDQVFSRNTKNYSKPRRSVKVEKQNIEHHVQDVDYLNIEKLKKVENLPIILAELLKPYNFSYSIALQIFNTLDSQPGRKFVSPTHILVKDRKDLVITKKNVVGFESTQIPKNQTKVECGSFKLKISILQSCNIYQKALKQSSKNIAYLAYDKLKFPLFVRKWNIGDWFCPLGMNRMKKKLSDFLIDEKIPLNFKDKVWVLISEGAIVWVINHRIDERYKITEGTKKAYVIKLLQ